MDLETVASHQRGGRGFQRFATKASTLLRPTQPVIPLKDTRGEKRVYKFHTKHLIHFVREHNKENLVSIGDA